jgi:hypothetical protein
MDNNMYKYKIYLLESKYYKSYNNIEKRNLILKKLKKYYNKIGGKYDVNTQSINQPIDTVVPDYNFNNQSIKQSNDISPIVNEDSHNDDTSSPEVNVSPSPSSSLPVINESPSHAVNEASNRINSVNDTVDTNKLNSGNSKMKLLMNGLTLVSTEIPEFGPFIAILIMMVKMIDSVSMIAEMLVDKDFLQLSQFTIDNCNFNDFKEKVTNHYNTTLKGNETFNNAVDKNYNKIKDIIKSVVATEPVVGPLVVTFFDTIFSYELLCSQFDKQTKITIKGVEYDFAPYLCDTNKIKEYVCSRIDKAKQYLQNKANERKKMNNDNHNDYAMNNDNHNDNHNDYQQMGGLFDSLKESLKNATESIKNTAISIGKTVMPLAFPFIGLANIGESIANEIGSINLPPELLNLASKPALMLLEKSGGDVIILNMVTSIVDSNIDNIVKFIKTLMSLLFSLTVISDIIKKTKEMNAIGGDKNVKFNLRKNKYKSF